MELLNNNLKSEIRSVIIQQVKNNKYSILEKEIVEFVNIIYNNIPANKRISFGIVSTIKLLSEFIFDILVEKNLPLFEIPEKLYTISQEFKSRAVALSILSFYGLEDFKPVLPFFEKSADSEYWNEREVSAIFFRKLIKKYPEEMKNFLLKLVKSESPNIRRFVGETLRPVQENKWFFNDVEYPLSIIKHLFKEHHPYPRTSVGNNLSDISKKLPDVVFQIVGELARSGNNDSYWIAYRACRNLVKKYPERVGELLNISEYKYKKKIYKL